MARIVPSAAEISNFTHADCAELRSNTSKILSGIRVHAEKCSPNYGKAKKKPKAVKRRSTTPREIKNYEVYIPDIAHEGYDVPDEIPDSETAFYAAQRRLSNHRSKSKSQGKKKEKNRIQPAFMGPVAKKSQSQGKKKEKKRIQPQFLGP